MRELHHKRVPQDGRFKAGGLDAQTHANIERWLSCADFDMHPQPAINSVDK